MPARSVLAAARPIAVAAAVVASTFAGVAHFNQGTTAQTLPVQVSVNCTGNPETTRVHNVSSQPITVYQIGSLDEPRAGEPFTVNRVIPAGQFVTWQTGHAASSEKLTGSFIYDNDDPRDGAHVTTSIGTFTRTCGGVSNGPAPTATRRATNTPVRATNTPVRATNTPVRATSTPVRATSTPVRATSTPVRATSTPVRATSTPVRATSTPVRATSTPERATSTPVKATSTPTKVPTGQPTATRPPRR